MRHNTGRPQETRRWRNGKDVIEEKMRVKAKKKGEGGGGARRVGVKKKRRAMRMVVNDRVQLNEGV